MTNPVDDLGNPRVDFVWGNMAMQPDDQRDTITSGQEVLIPGNIVGNRGWDAAYKYPSEGLSDTLSIPLSVGDQSVDVNWQSPSYRYVTIPADNHIIAIAGYENFPGYTQGGIYDDLIPNTVVPNILGFTIQAAQVALSNANVNYNNDGSTTTGATALNDGRVSYQSVVGPINNDNVTVHFQTYTYVAPVTTHPIAGISVNSFPGHAALTGSDIYMYLLGRTVKPTVGNTITIADNTNTTLNQNWTVNVVEDNDSYNSGGTVCTLTAVGSAPTDPNTNSGGTWVLA